MAVTVGVAGIRVANLCSVGGKRKRPYDTVLPLANDLGLTVDVSCDRDDSECVADAVHDYEGDGNILIRYEHSSTDSDEPC